VVNDLPLGIHRRAVKFFTVTSQKKLGGNFFLTSTQCCQHRLTL